MQVAFQNADWLYATSLIRTGLAFKYAHQDEHKRDHDGELGNRSLRIALAPGDGHTYAKYELDRGSYDRTRSPGRCFHNDA